MDLWCLVCSAEINEPNEIINKSFQIFRDQLFKLLLIPSEYLEDLHSLCTPRKFCQSCLDIAENIIALKTKILALELEIRHKVENMGKAVVEATSALETNSVEQMTKTWSRETKELWMKFQYPVIQNFGRGILPRPQIPMRKCDDSDQGSSEPVGLKELNSSSQESEKLDREQNLMSRSSISSSCTPSDDSLGITTTVNSSTDIPGEERSDGKEYNTTPEGYVQCPIEHCNYRLEYGQSLNRTYNSVLMNLVSHYNYNHIEGRKNGPSLNSNGQEYYNCKSCSFQALVRQVTDSETVPGKLSFVIKRRRTNALNVLARHEMNRHYVHAFPKRRGNKPGRKRKIWPEAIHKVPSPKNQRVFECNFSNCDFSYEFTSCGEDDEIFKTPHGLEQLGVHCLKSHVDLPGPRTQGESNDMDHYLHHVDFLDGIHHLKCPNPGCGCVFILDKDENNRVESYRIFSEHYGVHMYNRVTPQELHGDGDCETHEPVKWNGNGNGMSTNTSKEQNELVNPLESVEDHSDNIVSGLINDDFMEYDLI